MLDSLKNIFHRLIGEVSTESYRFLYEKFTLSNRLVGLVGARGVGKTTLLLQYIKNNLYDKKKVFYFSADHIYFNQITLYKFVEDLFLTEGINIFFIDEIHKYKNWNQELKNLYDGFPSLTIVFSGSSSLDLIKGNYDLSRRSKLYTLPGLSFREYLQFNTDHHFLSVSFKELLENKDNLLKEVTYVSALKGHFKNYLRQGFYPFFHDDPTSYYQKILTVIDKTIYEDIVNFYSLKTVNLEHFKKILLFLTTIPPGEMTIHNLAKNLSIDDKTVQNYLTILQDTGLIQMVYPYEGGNQGLRKPAKLFLSNTNLQYALNSHAGPETELGTIRELFFIQSIKSSNLEIFHSKQGDYQIESYLFEIGGKNKNRSQFKGIKDVFLVKDDILMPQKHTLPLFYFGFLY